MSGLGGNPPNTPYSPMGASSNGRDPLQELRDSLQHFNLQKTLQEGNTIYPKGRDIFGYISRASNYSTNQNVKTIEGYRETLQGGYQGELEQLKQNREGAFQTAKSRTASQQEKEEAKKYIRESAGSEGDLAKKFEEANKRLDKILAEAKKQSGLQKEQIDAIHHEAEQTIVNDKEAATKQTQEYLQGKYKPQSAEEEIRLKTQAGMLGLERKPGFFERVKDYAGGYIVGRGVYETAQGALGSVGKMGKDIASMSSYEDIEAQIKTIPLKLGKGVLDIVSFGLTKELTETGLQLAEGAIEKHLHLLDTAKRANLGYTAITGQGIFNPEAAPYIYGFSPEQYAQIAGQQTRARGGVGGDINGLLAISKGFGIDTGTLLGYEGLNRFRNKEGLSKGVISEDIKLLINALKIDPNNSVKLSEILEEQNQIMSKQLSTQNETSFVRAGNQLKALSDLGYEGKVGMQMYEKIDEGLRHPKNEFQQARAFGVLTQANPNANIMDLMVAQEGAFGNTSYRSGIMKDLVRRHGSEGPEFELAIMSAFPGLTPIQARDFAKKYRDNPGALENFGIVTSSGDNDIDFGARARGVMTERETEEQEINSSYNKSALEGISKTFEITGKHIETSIADLVEYIKKIL